MTKKRILIVDDEVLIADQLASFLETRGYATALTGSGEKAVQMLEEGFHPDLILMDIDLGRGRMDGTETARRVYRICDVPVVFHSCHSDESTIDKTKSVSKYGIIDKVPGNEVFLLATIEMAFSLHEANRMLKESEERYRTLAEAAHDMIFIVDRDGKVEYVNTFGAGRYGRPVDSLIGQSIETLFSPENFKHQHKSIGTVLKTGNPTYRENRFRFPDTEPWLGTWLVPLKDAMGRPRAVLGIARDISDRKNAEAALHESDERFRTLFENSTVGLYRTSPDGRILLANTALVRMLGYHSFGEMARRNLEKNGFEPSYPRDQFKKSMEADGEVRGLESAWKRLDGKVIYVRESAKAVRGPDGSIAYYEGTVENITEKKKAEESTQKALAEKDLLLRELQHRVKNNMALISSLLSLEMRNTAEPEIIRVFTEARDRIKSITQIYDTLYRSGSLKSVDFRETIHNLVKDLFKGYNAHPRVKFDIRADDVQIDLKKAVPCGLILNELISNALKYAFPKGKAGEVRVTFQKIGRGRIEMSVKDDGVGFERPFNIKDPKTMGLRIVVMMVSQIDGRLRVVHGGGTEFKITFPG
jgi:PAS domain S-box-containing protein